MDGCIEVNDIIQLCYCWGPR